MDVNRDKQINIERINNLKAEINKLSAKEASYRNMNTDILAVSDQLSSAKKTMQEAYTIYKSGYSSNAARKRYQKIEESINKIDSIIRKLSNIVSQSNTEINKIQRSIQSKTNLIWSLQ